MTANRGAIECVVFDVGGIIVRHTRDWREAHILAGFDPEHPVLEAREFLGRRQTLAMDHQTGRLTPEDYLTAVAESSAGAYSREDVERIIDAWLIDEYEGVGAFIDELLATGVTTAALSNTNPMHWARMLSDGGETPDFPTTARLHHHVASHEARTAKPEPAIYEALEALTGLEGSSLLFFDDRDDNIEAARARGWHAELIDHANDPPAQMRAVLRRYGMLD
jgi:FMN phosphatase YigB (HAD superfamily)